MKRVIIAIAVISAPMVAYGNTFVIEGPNHHDFLRLVDEREGLRYSLYHIPSGMYRGPVTLAEKGIDFNDYIK